MNLIRLPVIRYDNLNIIFDVAEKNMPAYHSSFGGGKQQVGNMAILPLKTTNRLGNDLLISCYHSFQGSSSLFARV